MVLIYSHIFMIRSVVKFFKFIFWFLHIAVSSKIQPNVPETIWLYVKARFMYYHGTEPSYMWGLMAALIHSNIRNKVIRITLLTKKTIFPNWLIGSDGVLKISYLGYFRSFLIILIFWIFSYKKPEKKPYKQLKGTIMEFKRILY